MGPADIAKLLYQNELGPEHMISNEAESLQRLTSEWEEIPHSPSDSFAEPIGNGLVRIYLGALKREELPILNAMFCQTANHVRGSKERFIRNLDSLSLYFPDRKSFLTEYKEKNYPPISHSDVYHKAYRPAYRVVLQSYAAFLQLVRTLHLLLGKNTRIGEHTSLRKSASFIVAIDGNCASGKTTLSNFLSMYFDCNVIHMDDFFLPPELRTAARLAQAGGNIHYERFAKEIMIPLQNDLSVSYRPFCCSTMDYGDTISLPSKPLTVVEGSYSMHPKLRSLYDYSVFLSCSYEQQLMRIRARNGEEMLENFTARWIPMENSYFDAFQVRKSCSLTIIE